MMMILLSSAGSLPILVGFGIIVPYMKLAGLYKHCKEVLNKPQGIKHRLSSRGVFSKIRQRIDHLSPTQPIV